MFKVKNKTKKGVRLCLFLTAWLSLSLSVFDELCLIATATCKRNFAFPLHVSGVN